MLIPNLTQLPLQTLDHHLKHVLKKIHCSCQSFFRLKLLQQLPRLDSCPKRNSFNEKITNFFLTLSYLFFKIIKLTTKHKNLDFFSQIHLGDGCQMVSIKFKKKFNTRIFLQQNLCSRAYILNSKQV
jgi:hypothetical protein